MQRIHRAQSKLRGKVIGRRNQLATVTPENSAREELLIESNLSTLLVANRHRQDFEPQVVAGKEFAIRIAQYLQRLIRLASVTAVGLFAA